MMTSPLPPSTGAGVPTGTPLPDPPLIDMISEDPVLRGTKMIAEAWDCDGLNQVWGEVWEVLWGTKMIAEAWDCHGLIQPD